MASCLIALGGNLGDRAANLQAALDRLARTPGISNLVASQFVETAPVGGPTEQPTFLNAAARFDCQLSPLGLAQRMHEIEAELGRVREIRWDARTVDLDLLLYDDLVSFTTSLQLPHPRMTFRRFVLEPAAEIALHMKHPSSGWTIGEHLEHLRTTPPLLCLCGGSKSFQRELAAEVAESLAAKLLLESGELSQTAEGTMENLTQWVIACDDSVTQFVRPPRLRVALEEAVTDERADRSTPSSGQISLQLARALTKAPGGSILRVNTLRPQAEVTAEIVAAAQATE